MSLLPRWIHLGALLAVIAHWSRRVFGTSGLLGFAGLIFALEGMGVPVPVEIPLYIVGVMMSRGTFTFGHTVLLTWVATVLGNSAGYLVGYYGGRPLILALLNWLRIPIGHFETVEHWFNKYGLTLALGTRWINWGFAQNIWLLGITRYRFATYFAVMAINDLLWAMAWNWVALHFVRHLHLLGRFQRPLLLVVLAVVAVGVGIWLWRRRRTGQPKDPGGK